MTTSVFHIAIVTPGKTLYQGDISSLIVPSEWGYWGILAHHAPLIAHLVKGTITVKDADGKVTTFASQADGFVEVLKNTATVIVESAAPTQNN